LPDEGNHQGIRQRADREGIEMPGLRFDTAGNGLRQSECLAL
jgi:hypothetical protein